MVRRDAPIDDASRTRRTVRPRLTSPIATSAALFVTGLVALGAAAVLLPRLGPRTGPTHPEVERVQAPQAALQRSLDAGTSVAGNGVVPPRAAEEPPPSDLGRTPETNVATAPPAHAQQVTNGDMKVTNGNMKVANGNNEVTAGNIAGGAGNPGSNEAPAASGSAIGGGPPATSAGDGGVELGDATTNVPYVAPLLAAPVYGAPPSSTSNGPPTVYGAAGDAAPLWTGGGAGVSVGGGGGNSGVVNPRPSIATSFLMTMSDADDPERAWTSISAYVHPSDVVVAHIGAGGPNDAAYLDLGDRVHIDAPLVQYVLAVDDPAAVTRIVAKGVPMNVNAVGPARTDGIDAATLNTLSSAVHAAGRKFFLSVSTSSSIPLSVVGSRADVIELVVGGLDANAAVAQATKANAQLHGGGAPTIFVRLPSSASSATAAGDFIGALQSAVPNVGVSVPYGTDASSIADLRSSP